MLVLGSRARLIAVACIVIASACSPPYDPASIPCGGYGQECCSSARNPQPCDMGMICIAGTCNHCGASEQPCCTSGNPCIGANDHCGADGLCEVCNDPGQTCCEGQECFQPGPGLCMGGTCLQCGHAGQPCCSGTCPFALECNVFGSCDNVGSDAGARDGGPLPLVFAPCTTTRDCMALGTHAMCLTAYPGGICTTTCTTDRNCGPAGHCAQGQCFPACTSGDQSCDHFGGMCVPVNAGEPPTICVPSCFPSGAMLPSPGFPSCPSSEACDPYTTACDGMKVPGAEDGASCTADTDCAGGRCITEVDPSTGMPTGFLGGYCLSFGYRLADSTYVANRPLPHGNCPFTAAPVPFSDTFVGDSTACFATCANDSDCRAGYGCQPIHTSDGGTTSTGFCMPIDCNMPGMSCPSGFTCVSQPSDAATAPGVCARNADGSTTPDASVDAGIDGG